MMPIHRMSRWLGIFVLACLAIGATSRPTEPQPDTVIRLNTPDGESIDVVARLPQFDAWSFLCYHWPELLLSVWVLLATRALFRTYRRKQDPAHEYCCRRNYSLYNLAPTPPTASAPPPRRSRPTRP